jgi:membrane peptidoglycan carboxypeptidase
MATSKKYDTSGKGGTTTLPIFTSYTAQAASTYKLFPLLAALSTGVPSGWQLQTPNGPYQWTACSEDNGKVLNGDANEFYNPGGNLTMDEATIKSSNTFFVGIADQLFGCNLQPIIDMAARLGMKSLSQPTGERGVDVAQSILKYGRATLLTLGDIATSPLELTSAYAAVANDGRYNAPSPIKSITSSTGQPMQVPRTPGQQVVSPQVARQAVQILTGDTQAPGTSTDAFASWYAAHPGLQISGKTGTAPGIDPKTGKDDKNGALWFVGMTPKLVATTALVNLDNPSRPASGLPGVPDPGVNAYGAYAAKVWINALSPTLGTQSWSWPSPDQVNGDPVPNVTNLSPADARRELKRSGYTMAVLGGADGLNCASPVPPGEIAFYGPSIAPKGATITVCVSSGVKQQIYVYVPPPPPPVVHPTHNPGHGGGSSSAPTGGGHSSGGGGGGGNGGGGGGNGHGGGNTKKPSPPNPG